MNHDKILERSRRVANDDTHHGLLHTSTATATTRRTTALLENDTRSGLVSMLIIRDVFFPKLNIRTFKLSLKSAKITCLFKLLLTGNI